MTLDLEMQRLNASSQKRKYSQHSFSSLKLLYSSATWAFSAALWY